MIWLVTRVLANLGLIDAILLFFFIGVLPGTDITIPPVVLMAVYLSIAAMGIKFILSQNLFIGERDYRTPLEQPAVITPVITDKVAHTARKKRLSTTAKVTKRAVAESKSRSAAKRQIRQAEAS